MTHIEGITRTPTSLEFITNAMVNGKPVVTTVSINYGDGSPVEHELDPHAVAIATEAANLGDPTSNNSYDRQVAELMERIALTPVRESPILT